MTAAVITRGLWGAHSPTGPWTPWRLGQPTGTTIHYEGAGGHTDHGMCTTEVRSIQAYHQHSGYVDIAYNWLVCQHGIIFEGRPVHLWESAAQKAGNSTHIAICYIGGPLTPLTAAAKSAINHILLLHAPVLGHRDEPSCSTSCPGSILETWIHTGHPGGTPVSFPAPAPKPLPLPPLGIHHPILAQGSLGPAVLELQHKLNRVSGASLVADGHFGPNTRQAVVNFQRFFKLWADGIAGQHTWAVLDYAYALKH